MAEVRGRRTWGRLVDVEAGVDGGGGYNQKELTAAEVGRVKLAYIEGG